MIDWFTLDKKEHQVFLKWNFLKDNNVHLTWSMYDPPSEASCSVLQSSPLQQVLWKYFYLYFPIYIYPTFTFVLPLLHLLLHLTFTAASCENCHPLWCFDRCHPAALVNLISTCWPEVIGSLVNQSFFICNWFFGKPKFLYLSAFLTFQFHQFQLYKHPQTLHSVSKT